MEHYAIHLGLDSYGLFIEGWLFDLYMPYRTIGIVAVLFVGTKVYNKIKSTKGVK
jgi:hypothetical protein